MSSHWVSYSFTDIGNKRTINQDAIFVSDHHKIWLVADGMGGHKAGEYASQLIVETFQQADWNAGLAGCVVQACLLLEDVNNALQILSLDKYDGEQVGSTVTIMIERNGLLVFLWMGDSRAYQLHENRLDAQQITTDHTYVNEMLSSGAMSEQEAKTSKFSHILTRAVGAHEQTFVDILLMLPKPKTTYLLCSDGLSNSLSDEELATHVAVSGVSQRSLESLKQKVLNTDANDNVSCVMVHNTKTESIEHGISTIESVSSLLKQQAGFYSTQKQSKKSYYQILLKELSNLTNENLNGPVYTGIKQNLFEPGDTLQQLTLSTNENSTRKKYRYAIFPVLIIAVIAWLLMNSNG